MFLEIVKNSQENTVLESLFNNAAGRMAYQDTSTQVFSCEICKIYKNTYFEEHLLEAAPDFTSNVVKL